MTRQLFFIFVTRGWGFILHVTPGEPAATRWVSE